MDKIEVAILNPDSLTDAEHMMVFAGRLTQRGHSIKSMEDLIDLYGKDYSMDTVRNMSGLPHPTIQKFGLINIAIVGASRRFLAQITRHQNEVKFMSGSLQYSDYSDGAQFTVPYEVMQYDHEKPQFGSMVDGKFKGWAEQQYLNSCLQSMDDYRKACEYIEHDAASYMMPHGMRNILLMSVQPFELKHIIQQRCCNRNSLETQYVMLLIWEKLKDYPMFKNIHIPCQWRMCPEGRMSCGKVYPTTWGPTEIINARFPLIHERKVTT